MLRDLGAMSLLSKCRLPPTDDTSIKTSLQPCHPTSANLLQCQPLLDKKHAYLQCKRVIIMCRTNARCQPLSAARQQGCTAFERRQVCRTHNNGNYSFFLECKLQSKVAPEPWEITCRPIYRRKAVN